MRKLSLLLAICLMLVCFVSCKDDKKDGGSTDEGATTQATQATQTTEAPEEDETTKTPETPQDKWTGRY